MMLFKMGIYTRSLMRVKGVQCQLIYTVPIKSHIFGRRIIEERKYSKEKRG